MLTDKENEFLAYWEAHRIQFKTVQSKFFRGLPMAMLFGIPILLSVAIVYFFSPDWYAKISSAAAGSIVPTVLAVCIAIVFFAYFRMHFLWEMNEQTYQELLQKKKKQEAAKVAP